MNVEPNLNRSIYTLALEIRNALYGRSPVGISDLDKDRIALVLVDGLGYSLAEKVGIRAEKIHSVFPTITVTVLTTLLTATPPGIHGIMGWRVLNRREGRIDNLLGNQDVELRNLVQAEPYLPRDSVILAPAGRPSSTLFKSLLGNVTAYYSPWDAFTQAKEIAERKNPRFMFIYIPFVDSVSHHFGPYSENTMRTAMEVYRLVETFGRDLSEKYSVVMTADHGHVPIEGNVMIGNDILDHVDLPPFGDHRNLMLMSRRDPSEYLSKYGLITLNREKLKELTGGENVPDYAGVPQDNRLYSYWRDEEEMGYRGSHGGMTREEIEIPLVVWQK
ncbi:alkaline phosphatase family protein [Metallosphaera sedula]|uniref:alkaline phosphatase family protein n=1 Tax=Metallosphaera sedula TaxID=43687 RepID=UPI0020BED560|nr:alkaline phosphatase family protein [Metallosphaera sedula]BBL46865.1 type I phosphodiesterase nucleotide pyrophosphatase [Metallosphaera sedula]